MLGVGILSRVDLLAVPARDDAHGVVDVVGAGARVVGLDDLGLLLVDREPKQKSVKTLKVTYEM